jgi:inner membrane protein
MKGKTHAGIGVAAFVFLYTVLPRKFALTNLIFAIIGALLPDIDHPKSFINRYLLPFRNQGTKVALFCSLGIFMLYLDNLYNSIPIIKIIGITLILIGLSTHRMGFTHSILGLILFSVVLSFFATVYELVFVEIYFVLGFLSHLVCDMLTKRGVPLFYPFSNKKYRFPFAFTTGSLIGNLIEGTLIIFSVVYATWEFTRIL